MSGHLLLIVLASTLAIPSFANHLGFKAMLEMELSLHEYRQTKLKDYPAPNIFEQPKSGHIGDRLRASQDAEEHIRHNARSFPNHSTVRISYFESPEKNQQEIVESLRQQFDSIDSRLKEAKQKLRGLNRLKQRVQVAELEQEITDLGPQHTGLSRRLRAAEEAFPEDLPPQVKTIEVKHNIGAANLTRALNKIVSNGGGFIKVTQTKPQKARKKGKAPRSAMGVLVLGGAALMGSQVDASAQEGEEGFSPIEMEDFKTTQ